MVLKTIYPKSTYRLKVPLNSCIDFTKNFDRLNFFYGTEALWWFASKVFGSMREVSHGIIGLEFQPKAKTTAVKGMQFFLEIILCILDYFFFFSPSQPW